MIGLRDRLDLGHNKGAGGAEGNTQTSRLDYWNIKTGKTEGITDLGWTTPSLMTLEFHRGHGPGQGHRRAPGTEQCCYPVSPKIRQCLILIFSPKVELGLIFRGCLIFP